MQRAAPKPCRLKGCDDPAVAERYCDDHLRERMPAAWARLHKIVGKTEPRLFTPPLRPLTRRTTRGYEVAEFAEMIGEPLLPWQKWAAIHALELLPDGSYRFRTILMLVARQNGKALDADTELLTARGFVALRSIREGDEVYHPSGHRTRVTAVSEIMQEHDCYRVTTTDGRTVIADRDHLWTVVDKKRARSVGPRGNVVRWFETFTLTTAEMMAAGLSRYAAGSRFSVTGGKRYVSNENRFQLPEQRPLESPDVPLPIDPYVLGVWLGDGRTTDAGLTCADLEIIDEIRKTGQPCHPASGRYQWRLSDGIRRGRGHGNATLNARLRVLGVLGNKHVPDIYLTAGTSQREALLQGLMDTDGFIDAARSQVEFCSTLPSLAEAVCFLARSLGWRATIRTGRAMLNGKDYGTKYRVMFTPKTTDPFCPFRLSRKVARIKAVDGNKGRATLSIAAIVPVESRPVRCIQVDSPDGLFLAGRDLIPTHNSSLKRTVSLWRLYVDGARLVLGCAQDVGQAREQWNYCIETARGCPELAAELETVRNVNGDEWFKITGGGRYKIAASNARAGRGLSVDELNIDELRTQTDWRGWSALSKTTMARSNAQIWAMSNAGDDTSVVLNQLRDAALSGKDSSIGLFEWSAPDNCDIEDKAAWAQANPGLGYTVSLAAIRSSMASDPPAVFRTEVLCQKVDQLDGAINLVAWNAGADPAGTMEGLRTRLAACFDIAPDGKHATLAVAGQMEDGRIRVEIVKAWNTTEEARFEMPGLLERIKPICVAWYPLGPGAAFAPMMRKMAGSVELGGGKVTEACQGLADLVLARKILHGDEPLLNAHIGAAQKLPSGDGWRFTRRGDVGHVDSAYAVAGAVYAIQTAAPPARGRVRFVAY